MSVEEYASAMAGLVTSPGWKLLQLWAKGRRESEVQAMTSSQDPNELLKRAGVIQGIDAITAYPDCEVNAYRINRRK